MNLLFIGGGNMATALIGGLLESNSPVSQLQVIEPNSDAQNRLSTRLASAMRQKGISFAIDTSDCTDALAKDTANTWVVLAVKPQQMKEACLQAKPNVKKCLSEGMLLSIAAGISVASIAEWTGNRRIVRAMPNTPALVGQGMTGLFADKSLSAQAKAQAEQLTNAVGRSLWVNDESLMDTVTAVSGSGPAYVFRFIESLIAAGESLGLSKSESTQLSLQTIKGAMALLESSQEDPAVLRERVTSKGGTTAAALASLDQDHFMAIMEKALKAARDRGTEMSREFK
jgi:pyrroline-5-carboxylate reductase